MRMEAKPTPFDKPMLIVLAPIMLMVLILYVIFYCIWGAWQIMSSVAYEFWYAFFG